MSANKVTMKILVAVKRVIDYAAKIRVKADKVSSNRIFSSACCSLIAHQFKPLLVLLALAPPFELPSFRTPFKHRSKSCFDIKSFHVRSYTCL